MKPKIISEARHFLETTGMSARKLALEAGIEPNTLTRVLAGARLDMTSLKADKVRDAMRRLAQESPNAT